MSVSLSPIIRPQQRRAAGLLLSAVRAGDIDRQWQAPDAQQQQRRMQKRQHRAAARRSAANEGSVMSTAELSKLNTDLLMTH